MTRRRDIPLDVFAAVLVVLFLGATVATFGTLIAQDRALEQRIQKLEGKDRGE